jgi:arsenate reductase
MYSYVITVCDESNGERCPLFPGITQKIAWSFDDPSALTGSEEEKLNAIRTIRDKIKIKIQEFIKEI